MLMHRLNNILTPNKYILIPDKYNFCKTVFALVVCSIKWTYFATRVLRCWTCRKWYEVVSVFDYLNLCIISWETVNADRLNPLNFGTVPLIKSKRKVVVFLEKTITHIPDFCHVFKNLCNDLQQTFSRDSLLISVFTMSLTSSEKQKTD